MGRGQEKGQKCPENYKNAELPAENINNIINGTKMSRFETIESQRSLFF